jgi:hypothetical protein
MLFSHWERRCPYLSVATPLAEEGLLVPFYVNGKSVGTIWAITHNDLRKFDAEDLRLLESMGRFASAAYQVVESIEDLSVEITARAKVESELRDLTEFLVAGMLRDPGLRSGRDQGVVSDASPARSSGGSVPAR